MMDDSKLSVNNLVEFAMGISMASLFAEAMNSAQQNNMRLLTNNQMTVPPKYIHVIVGGKTVGPLSLGEVVTMIQSGDITPDTYMWKPGMADWKAAREVTDLGIEVNMTPPQMP